MPRARPVADQQLAFAFGYEPGGTNGLPTRPMSEILEPSGDVVAKPKAAKRVANTFSAADSLKEANRLMDEGLLIRYATVRRRLKLRGPMNFSEPNPEVPPLVDFAELIPVYLKKLPEGWTVTPQGFFQVIPRADAAVIAKLINARRDELGVFSCERGDDGYRIVFEF